MLTKQEREEIAERIEKTRIFDSHELYRVVTGATIPNDQITLGDIHDIARVILDLCDTSHMVELPLDKDGEVIRVGDTVYDEFNDKAVVKSIKYARDENVRVFALNSLTDIVVTYSPNCLTHRYISKAEQLAESITSAIDEFQDKLRELLAYVESLGDSDD